MKAYNYTIVRPNGEVEKISVPVVWDPFEVAAKLEHDQVYFHVPAKHAVSDVWTDAGRHELAGPAVCLVLDGEYYQVPRPPQTDTEDLTYWQAIQRSIAARRAA